MSEIVAEYASSSGWVGRGDLRKLGDELRRQQENRVDCIVDTRQLMLDSTHRHRLVLRPIEGTQATEWIDEDGVPFMEQAIEQLAERFDPSIPSGFLKRLLADRNHRALDLMNGLWSDKPTRLFFRILDGNVRAVLSDRYKVMDHLDIAVEAITAAQELEAEPIEASLSDRHMRLKLTSRAIRDKLAAVRNSGDRRNWYAGGLGNQSYLSQVGARTQGELDDPDVIHPVVTIRNSETGHGGLNVRIGILQAVCFNLATVEEVVNKVHLGRRLDAGIYGNETRSLDAQTAVSAARDAVRAAFNPELFSRLVARIRASTEDVIEAPGAAVDNIVAANNLSDDDKVGILAQFQSGTWAATRYGLAQSIGRYAQEIEGAEKSAELEELAGAVMLGR